MGIKLDGMIVIAIIMVIIFAMVYDPASIAYVIIAICLLFTLTKTKRVETSTHTPSDYEPEPDSLELDQPEEPETKEENPAPSHNMEKISDDNLYNLDQIYGNRYAGSIDSRITEHAQRIGDRDRQATINQIKSRRNNVYEPYYRQELSEIGSKRWWDNDTVLSRKAVDNWMGLIMTGRHAREGDNPCPTSCHIPIH